MSGKFFGNNLEEMREALGELSSAIASLENASGGGPIDPGPGASPSGIFAGMKQMREGWIAGAVGLSLGDTRHFMSDSDAQEWAAMNVEQRALAYPGITFVHAATSDHLTNLSIDAYLALGYWMGVISDLTDDNGAESIAAWEALRERVLEYNLTAETGGVDTSEVEGALAVLQEHFRKVKKWREH